MNLKAKNLVNRVKTFVFLEQDLIGKGATGKVYKGLNQLNGEQVAIKVMQMSKIDNEVTEYLLACQKQALTSISNPYVLHAYDIIQMQDQCLIITPLYTGGTLKQHITSQGKLPEQEALLLFVKMLRGYISIKQKGFVHRDIKSSNVMFKNNDPVIIDFGYCQKIASRKPKMFYNVGSPSYMSPQAYFKTIYSQKSDLWALGIILYEMLEGYTIDHGQPIDRYFSTLLRHGFVLRNKISDQTKIMLKSILNPNPNQRPNTEQLIQITQIIIFSGKQFHQIPHFQQQQQYQNSPLKSKFQSYGFPNQPILHNKISLKQSHKKNNNFQMQQLLQQKLIQSRQQYQQIQQIQQFPQKKSQINRNKNIQQNSPTPIKIFQSRNKNQQFSIKLSQSIYKPENSGLIQSQKLANQNQNINARESFITQPKSSQFIQHSQPIHLKGQNMQQVQPLQFFNHQQQPQLLSPLQFQIQNNQHQFQHQHQNTLNNQKVIAVNHQNIPKFAQQPQQFQINSQPLNSQQLHQILQMHTQNKQHHLQQREQQNNLQRQQHQFINIQNTPPTQSIKLSIPTNQIISTNSINQLQINPHKLTPQYRSMIQPKSTNNQNKLLTILQNGKNIKVCHSKIFNSESILSTNDPYHNLLSVPQQSPIFNNVIMTDSIHSRNQNLISSNNYTNNQHNNYNNINNIQSLNIPRPFNQVVQSLIIQPQNNSINNSFHVNNPVYRSIILQKQLNQHNVPRNNINQIQQYHSINNNNINAKQFKSIQQLPNNTHISQQQIQHIPQFTQIRNSIGNNNSQQFLNRQNNNNNYQNINVNNINTSTTNSLIIPTHDKIQTSRPLSPIARQKNMIQNIQQMEQRNQHNVNVNPTQRNFFKKTQPYFHMNTNFNIKDQHQQENRQKLIIPNRHGQIKQQLPLHLNNVYNLNQIKQQNNNNQHQYQHNNNNQPTFFARHTMPNFQRSNMPIPNYPPQRASIQTNHYPNHYNQHNHQKQILFRRNF